LCLASRLWASDIAAPYLAPGHPDAIALLAPPPESGSSEEAADLDLVRSVFKSRTPAEEVRAKSEDTSISFYNFASAIGPFFQPGKFPKTDALLNKVKVDIRESIGIPKKHWNRKRPYQMDSSLTFSSPEKSASYPSGHSSYATVNALILAELFPKKREAILKEGRDIGWDRVLIGKHFLTDIRAGRVLGQAIVRELMANPAFQHDLAEAKAEIDAARVAKGIDSSSIDW